MGVREGGILAISWASGSLPVGRVLFTKPRAQEQGPVWGCGVWDLLRVRGRGSRRELALSGDPGVGPIWALKHFTEGSRPCPPGGQLTSPHILAPWDPQAWQRQPREEEGYGRGTEMPSKKRAIHKVTGPGPDIGQTQHTDLSLTVRSGLKSSGCEADTGPSLPRRTDRVQTVKEGSPPPFTVLLCTREKRRGELWGSLKQEVQKRWLCHRPPRRWEK